MPQVARSVDVDAPAELVWALVSDLPRMGDYSPENTGGRWVRGGGPVTGAVFRGTNRREYARRWVTWAYVTQADPGRVFEFRVGAGPVTTAVWSFRIEPTERGCRLTETWQDRRSPLVAKLGDFLSGEPDRAGYTVRSIDQTLAALKAAAEGSSA